MADVINLNRARKRKARTEKAAQAETNRVKFGRGGAEKRRERLERDRDIRDLDGKKRDPGPEQTT